MLAATLCLGGAAVVGAGNHGGPEQQARAGRGAAGVVGRHQGPGDYVATGHTTRPPAQQGHAEHALPGTPDITRLC
jgi:hypothetical protein